MGLAYKEIEGRRIVANEEKCYGCLVCQLRCSFRFEKAFNPAKAAIRINRFAKGGIGYLISFTDKCDACGICAKHCPYGALTWIKENKKAA
jgi:NAD-dependent dihydropyrimidine dehydrogenase PreA subunit